MPIPRFVSPEKYAAESGLGVAEIKRLCKLEKLPCEITEGGHYKIKVYDDCVSIEEYEKVKEENTRLKTLVKSALGTLQQV